MRAENKITLIASLILAAVFLFFYALTRFPSR
jgi:hypothetical protein